MSSHVPFEPLPGSNGQPTATVRHGDTILRPAGPWTPAVHALLRHLEEVGFPASPQVVGDGYDDRGREVLTYVEGRIAHPHPYTDEGIWQVGRLLRDLHDATAGFRPPPAGGTRSSASATTSTRAATPRRPPPAVGRGCGRSWTATASRPPPGRAW
jgi:hypothetical protein